MSLALPCCGPCGLPILLLFRGNNLAAWIGLVIVVQNVVGSFFNSHLFDFVQGWVYVVGVGVAGGMVLNRHQSEYDVLAELSAARPPPDRSSWASPPRPTTSWPTDAPSSPARAATCWWSTRSATPTFGREENEAVVLDRDGGETAVPFGPKELLADLVWDLVALRL